MSDTPVKNATSAFLRPLASIKPQFLSAAVGDALNQVYGAARFAHLSGDSDSADILRELHTELTTVASVIDSQEQRRHVESLLVRWL